MRAYLDLARLVLDHGTDKPTRATLPSTGERVSARSIFGAQARFDLRQGFPAVTVKRLPFRGMVAELLWFLSGSTRLDDLHPAAREWWRPWASAEGFVAYGYGRHWRSFGYPNADRWRELGDTSVDQIARLVADLRAVRDNPEHPAARRMILTAWNPTFLDDTALPACHTLSQWSVTGGRLSCHLYQRSCDLLLGCPVNIASYALLLHLLARVVGLDVGEVVISYGDLHCYANHLDQAREMLTREPRPLPRLYVPEELEFQPLDGQGLPGFVVHHEAYGDGHPALLTIDDVILEGYDPHPNLTGEMAV
jgi:thymidylate synthase